MADESIILDRLFRPTKQVEIGGRKLTVRALSGPEQEARSLYAINQARKLEKELADAESDAFQMHLKPLADLSRENLVLLLKNAKQPEIRRKIEEDNKPIYIPFPDEAIEEEKREVLNKREEAETKRQAAITEQSDKALAEYVSSLDGKTDLLALAQASLAKSTVSERANMAFAYYTLYASVSNGGGKRYFENVAEASEISREVVFHIFREAQQIGSVDPLALSVAPLSSSGLSSTESPETSS